MKLAFLLFSGAINHFFFCCGRPEIELTKEFVRKHACPFIEASGTNKDLVKSLGFGQELPVPVVQVFQDAQAVSYVKHRECQVVFVTSEPGLELTKVEELTHGSSESLIAVTGQDHRELKSMNATRPIIYFEERGDSSIDYVHILCPHLYSEGAWYERVGYWNSHTFKTLHPLLDLCPLALVGSSVNVAWAISQGM